MEWTSDAETMMAHWGREDGVREVVVETIATLLRETIVRGSHVLIAARLEKEGDVEPFFEAVQEEEEYSSFCDDEDRRIHEEAVIAMELMVR